MITIINNVIELLKLRFYYSILTIRCLSRYKLFLYHNLKCQGTNIDLKHNIVQNYMLFNTESLFAFTSYLKIETQRKTPSIRLDSNQCNRALPTEVRIESADPF